MSNVARKKQIGAYYTPKRVADLLTDWALQSSSDTLLEPSFGGCGFLDAAHERLGTLGATSPISQLYGFDIDKAAFEELGHLFGDKVVDSGVGSHFLLEDFMTATPDKLIRGVHDAIVGNPPYVSYHSMDAEQRRVTAEFLDHSEFQLDRKASLWAYFVLHALDFLKPGGRVAWVLPGSFVQTQYGAEVRKVIAEKFSRSVALQLNERLFLNEGTEENSVILLGEGWKQAPDDETLSVGYAESLQDLEEIVEDWSEERWKGSTYKSRIGVALMQPQSRSAIAAVEEDTRVVSLSDIVDIKIGIVTGANRFFVIDKSTAENKGLRKSDVDYILPKFRVAKGLSVTEVDFDAACESGERCLFVRARSEDEMTDRLESYFRTFAEGDRKSNATFKKRSDWRDPDDPYKPDAFFPYMHQKGPRLVLNKATVNSTNTVHRVYFKGKRKPDLFRDMQSEVFQKAITVSMISTFTQLSSELEGRAYGSGVLKHEPSDAGRIKIILPVFESESEVERTFRTIDDHLRNGDLSAAEAKSNEIVFRGLSSSVRNEVVRQLKHALQCARDRRSVNRNGN
jgi:adenine-specific DNA methylase